MDNKRKGNGMPEGCVGGHKMSEADCKKLDKMCRHQGGKPPAPMQKHKPY